MRRFKLKCRVCGKEFECLMIFATTRRSIYDCRKRSDDCWCRKCSNLDSYYCFDIGEFRKQSLKMDVPKENVDKAVKEYLVRVGKYEPPRNPNGKEWVLFSQSKVLEEEI